MTLTIIDKHGYVVHRAEIYAEDFEGDLIAAIQAEIAEVRAYIENGTHTLKLSPPQ